MSVRRGGAAALAVWLLGSLTVACGPDAEAEVAGSAPAVVGPPILTVGEEGGFTAPGVDFGRLPTAFVSADGRLISPGPQILIFPGPALPNLRQRALTPAGVVALRGLAEEAGLARQPLDYGLPPVADVPTTVFTYRDAEGRTFLHRVEALGFDAGLTPAQQEARAALRRLLDQLADPEGSLGAGEVGDDTPLEPEAFRIRAAPVTPDTPGADGDDGIEPQVLPWPVDSGRLAQPANCTPITGPDAAVLREAMEGANQLTRWTQDGVTHTVQIRALLPGEAACS